MTPGPVTLWPSLRRPAEGREHASRALVARVREPRTYPDRDAVARWSGAVFRDGYRSLATFLRASWLVLDLDRGQERDTPVRMCAVFGSHLGAAHTTWSSSAEVPRWRVALVLSRAVDRDEFDRCWRAGAALAEAAELTPDYAARDASHAWALPAARSGYAHVLLRGAPLDVEDMLARFPPPAPLPPPAARPSSDDYGQRLSRASRYLAAMEPAIQGSHGSTQTMRAAVALVRGFLLEPDDALHMLVTEYSPRCEPPWSLHELRHKVRQAGQRSRLPAGFLADAQRPR